jgi:hypothetical protein
MGLRRKYLYGVAMLVIAALAILAQKDGYGDYPVQVIDSEQANDNYLEALLKSAGFEGKRVDAPNYNLQESTLLTRRLEKNDYAVNPPTKMVVAPPVFADAPRPPPRDNRYVITILLSVALIFGLSVYFFFPVK